MNTLKLVTAVALSAGIGVLWWAILQFKMFGDKTWPKVLERWTDPFDFKVDAEQASILHAWRQRQAKLAARVGGVCASLAFLASLLWLDTDDGLLAPVIAIIGAFMAASLTPLTSAERAPLRVRVASASPRARERIGEPPAWLAPATLALAAVVLVTAAWLGSLAPAAPGAVLVVFGVVCVLLSRRAVRRPSVADDQRLWQVVEIERYVSSATADGAAVIAPLYALMSLMLGGDSSGMFVAALAVLVLLGVVIFRLGGLPRQRSVARL